MKPKYFSLYFFTIIWIMVYGSAFLMWIVNFSFIIGYMPCSSATKGNLHSIDVPSNLSIVFKFSDVISSIAPLKFPIRSSGLWIVSTMRCRSNTSLEVLCPSHKGSNLCWLQWDHLKNLSPFYHSFRTLSLLSITCPVLIMQLISLGGPC